MTRARSLVAVLAAIVAAGACASSPMPDADADRRDGGPRDAGVSDAAADSGHEAGLDELASDAAIDAYAVDSGVFDARPPDAGPSPDAGPCPPGRTQCLDGDGVLRCVDLAATPCHCGTCGRRCGGFPYECGCLDCGAGGITCFPPVCTADTRPVCTDLGSDTANCGACNHECMPGQSCVSGICRYPDGGV